MTTAVLRRAGLTAVLLVLTVFAVGGQYRFEGPVLLTLTTTHGVHAGDVVLSAVALVGLGLVWLPGRR